MKSRTKIALAFVAVFILSGIYIYQDRSAIKVIPKIPKMIVQYAEIATKAKITAYKASHKPDIVKVSKEGECWIVTVNKLAIKEIERSGATIRLHIGYCYWESNKVINGRIIFSPTWHPPYTHNRVVVGLFKNGKYLCSIKVW